jgi:hypothetical protein
MAFLYRRMPQTREEKALKNRGSRQAEFWEAAL